MSYLNFRAVSTAAIVATLVTGSTWASNVPDEYATRAIGLTSAHVIAETFTRQKPGAEAVKKVLHHLGLPQTLASTAPVVGGFGETYLSTGVVVKITMPGSDTPSGESARLFTLKREIGRNPCPGVHLEFPKVIYAPYATIEWNAHDWNPQRPNLGTNPYHMQVAVRVYPVKDMMEVTADVLVHNQASAYADIRAFGAALGRMQASTLIHRYGDRYVSLAHMDLNPNNILPTGLPSRGQAAAFTIIDLGDMRKATDLNAVEVSTDVIYHLHKTWLCATVNPAYRALTKDQEKTRIQAYTRCFFEGLLGEFSTDIRKAFKPIYTSMTAINKFRKNRIWAVHPYAHEEGQILDVKHPDWVIPAIADAFRHFEIPAAVPTPAAQPPIARPTPVVVPAPVVTRPLPQGFDIKAYIANNPDIARDAPKFNMSTENFAIHQWKTWGWYEARVFLAEYMFPQAYLDMYPDVLALAKQLGKNPLVYAQEHWFTRGRYDGTQGEGRLTMAGPFVKPDNFCVEAYRALYPDIDFHAPRFAMRPDIFAMVQFIKWGKAEGRLVLSKPITVPSGFNTQRYIEKYRAKLEAEAKKFLVPDLTIYAKAQYSQWGASEGLNDK